MGYSYTPTYYSTLHDSITSLCKTVLPFGFKKRCLPSAEHKLAKLQSDNLKWQQDSFHQILNLMGLHKEGILAESEVSAFRSHLLDTLIAAPVEHEQPVVLRDKLLFLQELLYAKCITENEYHSSKRPLLQRLAVQGAEVESKDLIIGDQKQKDLRENSEEEWSVIDLRDKNYLLSKENSNSNSKNKSKHSSAIKHIKGASSFLGFSYKTGKHREEKSIFDSIGSNNDASHFNLKNTENEKGSILMPESLPSVEIKGKEKAKRKPFGTLFQKEQSKQSSTKLGFVDGFKKWKRDDSEDETAALPINGRSDCDGFRDSNRIVSNPIGEGPDTKSIKRNLHSDGSSSDFFIDKVLGEKIKKELSRIQAELGTTNPNLKFSEDQIEAISTKLPVEKADLKNFFPKSWCDRHGDVVLDVVKKEFKDHVGEMENLRNNSAVIEKNGSQNSMKFWTKFDEDDENFHPNLFGNQEKHSSYPFNNNNNHHSRSFQNNPFYDYS